VSKPIVAIIRDERRETFVKRAEQSFLAAVLAMISEELVRRVAATFWTGGRLIPTSLSSPPSADQIPKVHTARSQKDTRLSQMVKFVHTFECRLDVEKHLSSTCLLFQRTPVGHVLKDNPPVVPSTVES
jgi:hypothetical protein